MTTKQWTSISLEGIKKLTKDVQAISKLLDHDKPEVVAKVFRNIENTCDFKKFANYPTINQLLEIKRLEPEIEFIINKIIQKFLSSFSFNKQMPLEQKLTLVYDTIDKMGYLPLREVFLFFKMARSGDLGTTSRNIDSNLIFGEYLKEYKKIKQEKIKLIRIENERKNSDSLKLLMQRKEMQKNLKKVSQKLGNNNNNSLYLQDKIKGSTMSEEELRKQFKN